MLRRVFCLSLVGCSIGPAFAIADESVNTIDLAGRQRMLSQRIAKAYAQIGAKVLPGLSAKVLRDSIADFSQQQEQLRTVATLPDQQKLIAVIDGQWAEVLAITNIPVDRGRAAELQSKVNAMERLSSQLTYLLRGAHSFKMGKLINVAGRQRMLSQRLAKAYMLRAWGVDIPNLRIEMAIAADEFSSALLVLQQAPENTPGIQRELDSITTQWDWFQTAVDLEGTFSYRVLIADSSEALLSSLENLVVSYSRLPGVGTALR
jgi:hypothetical protein